MPECSQWLATTPALIVPSVGVNASEHAVVYGNRQFMLESVSGESGVIDLDVGF